MERIESRHYVATRWITLEGYTTQEMIDVINQIKNIPQFDGYDEEDKCFCLTFKTFIPRREQEIRICKVKNENIAKYRMKLIKEIIFKKYPKIYFNLNRLVIKKL